VDNHNPPIRGKQYIFNVSLASQADPRLHQVNPTLAAGDVKISKDNGAFANLTTLPTVAPAGGALLQVTVSAAEMTADNVAIRFSDAAGAEWCDLTVNIQPTSMLIAGAVNDPTALATSSVFNTSLSLANDFINNAFLVFTSGALAGESRKVGDFANASGQVTLATALTGVPADGDKFVIVGRSE
jgi:hypothetical protein